MVFDGSDTISEIWSRMRNFSTPTILDELPPRPRKTLDKTPITVQNEKTSLVSTTVDDRPNETRFFNKTKKKRKPDFMISRVYDVHSIIYIVGMLLPSGLLIC